MPTLMVLAHPDLASPTLSDELAKSLLARIPADAPVPLEELDRLHTLAAQGATLAGTHKLTGPGEVLLSPEGVHVRSEDHAAAQPLDTAAVQARADARAAATAAAAKAQGRSKVAEVVKAGVAKVAAVVTGRTPARPAAPSAPAKVATTRPTTPPPPRRS